MGNERNNPGFLKRMAIGTVAFFTRPRAGALAALALVPVAAITLTACGGGGGGQQQQQTVQLGNVAGLAVAKSGEVTWTSPASGTHEHGANIRLTINGTDSTVAATAGSFQIADVQPETTYNVSAVFTRAENSTHKFTNSAAAATANMTTDPATAQKTTVTLANVQGLAVAKSGAITWTVPTAGTNERDANIQLTVNSGSPITLAATAGTHQIASVQPLTTYNVSAIFSRAENDTHIFNNSAVPATASMTTEPPQVQSVSLNIDTRVISVSRVSGPANLAIPVDVKLINNANQAVIWEGIVAANQTTVTIPQPSWQTDVTVRVEASKQGSTAAAVSSVAVYIPEPGVTQQDAQLGNITNLQISTAGLVTWTRPTGVHDADASVALTINGTTHTIAPDAPSQTFQITTTPGMKYEASAIMTRTSNAQYNFLPSTTPATAERTIDKQSIQLGQISNLRINAAGLIQWDLPAGAHNSGAIVNMTIIGVNGNNPFVPANATSHQLTSGITPGANFSVSAFLTKAEDATTIFTQGPTVGPQTLQVPKTQVQLGQISNLRITSGGLIQWDRPAGEHNEGATVNLIIPGINSGQPFQAEGPTSHQLMSTQAGNQFTVSAFLTRPENTTTTFTQGATTSPVNLTVPKVQAQLGNVTGVSISNTGLVQWTRPTGTHDTAASVQLTIAGYRNGEAFTVSPQNSSSYQMLAANAGGTLAGKTFSVSSAIMTRAENDTHTFSNSQTPATSNPVTIPAGLTNVARDVVDLTAESNYLVMTLAPEFWEFSDQRVRVQVRSQNGGEAISNWLEVWSNTPFREGNTNQVRIPLAEFNFDDMIDNAVPTGVPLQFRTQARNTSANWITAKNFNDITVPVPKTQVQLGNLTNVRINNAGLVQWDIPAGAGNAGAQIQLTISNYKGGDPITLSPGATSYQMQAANAGGTLVGKTFTASAQLMGYEDPTTVFLSGSAATSAPRTIQEIQQPGQVPGATNIIPIDVWNAMQQGGVLMGNNADLNRLRAAIGGRLVEEGLMSGNQNIVGVLNMQTINTTGDGWFPLGAGVNGLMTADNDTLTFTVFIRDGSGPIEMHNVTFTLVKDWDIRQLQNSGNNLNSVINSLIGSSDNGGPINAGSTSVSMTRADTNFATWAMTEQVAPQITQNGNTVIVSGLNPTNGLVVTRTWGAGGLTSGAQTAWNNGVTEPGGIIAWLQSAPPEETNTHAAAQLLIQYGVTTIEELVMLAYMDFGDGELTGAQTALIAHFSRQVTTNLGQDIFGSLSGRMTVNNNEVIDAIKAADLHLPPSNEGPDGADMGISSAMMPMSFGNDAYDVFTIGTVVSPEIEKAMAEIKATLGELYEKKAELEAMADKETIIDGLSPYAAESFKLDLKIKKLEAELKAYQEQIMPEQIFMVKKPTNTDPLA
ncbi:MAG: hypothetical protein FWD89_00100 [Firmicutes bacterium]|nr:hypothetical protein [Bacillota bacterium]